MIKDTRQVLPFKKLFKQKFGDVEVRFDKSFSDTDSDILWVISQKIFDDLDAQLCIIKIWLATVEEIYPQDYEVVHNSNNFNRTIRTGFVLTNPEKNFLMKLKYQNASKY